MVTIPITHIASSILLALADNHGTGRIAYVQMILPPAVRCASATTAAKDPTVELTVLVHSASEAGRDATCRIHSGFHSKDARF